MATNARNKTKAILNDYFEMENKPLNNWMGVPKDIGEYTGFVYLITNSLSGKKYIGQKKFWFKKVLPPLKGKKNKRRSLVESDWKTYYGSNEELKVDVKKYGTKHFIRTIIKLCPSKVEMNYYEAKEQFDKGVLLKDKYYNNLIQCKINGRGLK